MYRFPTSITILPRPCLSHLSKGIKGSQFSDYGPPFSLTLLEYFGVSDWRKERDVFWGMMRRKRERETNGVIHKEKEKLNEATNVMLWEFPLSSVVMHF